MDGRRRAIEEWVVEVRPSPAGLSGWAPTRAPPWRKPTWLDRGEARSDLEIAGYRRVGGEVGRYLAPSPSIEDTVVQIERDARVRELLAEFAGTLSGTRAAIFRARFLSGEAPSTTAVATSIGRSKGRVAQLEQEMLKGLRRWLVASDQSGDLGVRWMYLRAKRRFDVEHEAHMAEVERWLRSGELATEPEEDAPAVAGRLERIDATFDRLAPSAEVVRDRLSALVAVGFSTEEILLVFRRRVSWTREVILRGFLEHFADGPHAVTVAHGVLSRRFRNLRARAVEVLASSPDGVRILARELRTGDAALRCRCAEVIAEETDRFALDALRGALQYEASAHVQAVLRAALDRMMRTVGPAYEVPWSRREGARKGWRPGSLPTGGAPLCGGRCG